MLKKESKLDDALAAYREARNIFEAIARKGNTQAQASLIQLAYRIGDVLLAQRNVGEALVAYRECLAVARTLVEKDPSNLGRQRNLAHCNTKISDGLWAQGNLEEALAAMRESRSMLQSLLKEDPSNNWWRRDLGVKDQNIGDMLVAQEKLDEARDAYRQGYAVRKSLVEMEPNNLLWLSDLGYIASSLADVEARLGNQQDALSLYRESLGIAERLAAADPGDPRNYELATARMRVGKALEAHHELDDALLHYRASLVILQNQNDPNDTQWQWMLALAHEKVGTVLKAQRKLSEALDAYRQNLAVRKQIADRNPQNERFRRDVAKAYVLFGASLKSQEDYAAAIENYDQAIRLAPDLAAGWGLRCQARAVIGGLEDALSDCNEALRLASLWRFVLRAGLCLSEDGKAR
jgi:tetratricopeptide (TPR) repeat protein